jgi:hypothetical protein
LANKVGIEKTIIFFIKYKFAIDQYISLLRDIGFNKSDNTTIARLFMVIPTIIFAPASIIKQYFDKINNYFLVDIYYIYIYYSSKNNISYNFLL